ncbi:PEP-CTERM sorting domain-containing protein [Roseateles sp. PN1]|uniref:PEP-CTERM sorting domain-containing protein n=1 Tax=Roseateles sp. PN1 TaxID=3137372 RepID=UPI00313873E6
MKALITALALIAAPAITLAAQPNLLINGSFEDNAVANGKWNVFANISGWTSTGAGIEVRNNIVGSAIDGVKFVELDSYSNSGMFQTVGTSVGSSYNFSFSFANREGTAAATNGLDWTVDGGKTWNAAPTLNSSKWADFSTSFIASSASTVIGFRATGTNDALGTSLDKVSLTTAVPEPESYALMLAGLAAVGFVARRRKSA